MIAENGTLHLHSASVSPPQITLGILARILARATLAIAVSGRGEIPHWR